MHWIAPIAVWLVLAAPAHAEPAEIAFAGAGGISAMRADGSARRLLVGGRSVTLPAWSPDGSTLAYMDGNRVILRDAAGATREVLTARKGVENQSLAWSPDGAALLFARFVEEREDRYRSQIVTLTVASGAQRVIVDRRLDARFTQLGDPVYSPDGATVAYSSTRLGRHGDFDQEIRTVAAAGGASRTLIRDAHSPAYSPDGRRIAYAGIRDHNGRRCGSDECVFAAELYVANADGSGQTRLTRNQGDERFPAWSPDGSRLLFSSDQNLPDTDAFEVYSIAPDGSCLTWLTNGTPESGAAVWRPGSGDSFAPAGCDPATRPAVLGMTGPGPFTGGLWLGARYQGLLLSQTRRRSLWYYDCEWFSGCRSTIIVGTEPACRMFSFRGLTDNAYRFVLRKGALVAYADREANVRIFSGASATTLQIGDGSRPPDVERIIADLRPLDAAAPPSRLPAPRIPRALARQLEATARAEARHGTDGAARALEIEPFEVRQRLRLRTLLRPYRFTASCQ